MRPREIEAFKRQYFGQWGSEGIPVPLELAQHLVLGAVDYARSLGFEPHPGLPARAAGAGIMGWPERDHVRLERQAALRERPLRRPAASTCHARAQRRSRRISLQRLVGQADGLGDGYRYTATLTDIDDLGDAA